jgi:transposase
MLQRKRDNIVKNWCHQWSAEIVRFVRSMNAASITVIGLPTTLQERPFQWKSAFVFMLEYKAKLEGMTVTVKEASQEAAA